MEKILMAKDLPYFKFYSSEWNDGDITLEDYHTQGAFINVCSYYWSRECNLEKVKLYKRFRDCQGALDFLFESSLLNEHKGFVKIKFLDRQWTERENKKATMKANGLKGGRPKKNQKVSDDKTKSFPSANQNITNKEEKREEEKRKDKKISRFTPPRQEDVSSFCLERNNGVDSVKWFNFYAAKDWMIGKNKMKDWKAAVRTWEEKKDPKDKNPFTGGMN